MYGPDKNRTSYEIWTKKKPTLEHLRVFGSVGYTHIPKQLTKKLDDRSKKVLLVGYQGDSGMYKVYCPTTKKITISRDVIFNEKDVHSFTLESKISKPRFLTNQCN